MISHKRNRSFFALHVQLSNREQHVYHHLIHSAFKATVHYDSMATSEECTAASVDLHLACLLAGERPDLDRLQAAQRLVDNHEAVVKFAARGCGEEGSPKVMAPLSDPYAKPGMQYLHAVDAGMCQAKDITLTCCTERQLLNLVCSPNAVHICCCYLVQSIVMSALCSFSLCSLA